MMRRIFPHPWGWASLAPLLCAFHCALTPLLVVLAPTIAPGEPVEWTLLGLTVVLGASALAAGLTRHGDLRPAIPITIGLVAWGASLLHVFHPISEEITTIAASLTVASGLIWNARIHCAWRAGEGPGCAACEEVDAGVADSRRPAVGGGIPAAPDPEPVNPASTGS